MVESGASLSLSGYTNGIGRSAEPVSLGAGATLLSLCFVAGGTMVGDGATITMRTLAQGLPDDC